MKVMSRNLLASARVLCVDFGIYIVDLKLLRKSSCVIDNLSSFDDINKKYLSKFKPHRNRPKYKVVRETNIKLFD